jgi:hypothetical protein
MTLREDDRRPPTRRTITAPSVTNVIRCHALMIRSTVSVGGGCSTECGGANVTTWASCCPASVSSHGSPRRSTRENQSCLFWWSTRTATDSSSARPSDRPQPSTSTPSPAQCRRVRRAAHPSAASRSVNVRAVSGRPIVPKPFLLSKGCSASACFPPHHAGAVAAASAASGRQAHAEGV